MARSPESGPSEYVVGFDVGGTKTNVLNSDSDEVTRYTTANFDSPYEVIDTYLSETEKHPAVVCLGMAAVRNSADGSMRLAKRGWPLFKPEEASERYGAKVVTANDMITTAAGIFEQDVETEPIKPGSPVESDPTLVYAWSTGIGASLVVPSERNKYLPSAVGHAGLAPQHEDEVDYLRFVAKRHNGKLSIEFALAGEFGIDNLVDYYLEKNPDAMLDLYTLIAQDKAANVSTGQVLVDVARDGDSPAQAMAHKILNRLGGLLGYTLRNQVLAVQVGDIKMTGSVALSLAPYLAEHTSFIERFVDQEARCAYIPEAIAIDLVKDPLVAVKGSLVLAEKELERLNT
ncbi:MAG: glucokinase [Candidatus Saccharibacteria bacterium]|nr:glucokinase [Candidatus Saccharibacteria bacterium]